MVVSVCVFKTGMRTDVRTRPRQLTCSVWLDFVLRVLCSVCRRSSSDFSELFYAMTSWPHDRQGNSATRHWRLHRQDPCRGRSAPSCRDLQRVQSRAALRTVRPCMAALGASARRVTSGGAAWKTTRKTPTSLGRQKSLYNMSAFLPIARPSPCTPCAVACRPPCFMLFPAGAHMPAHIGRGLTCSRTAHFGQT